MNKNIFIVLLTSLLFSNLSFAQKFDLGNYEMEIIEVLHRKSVGSVFPHKNKKFVGIKALLSPKSKKNKGLYFNELVLKSGNDEYKVQLRRGLDFSSASGIYIKLKKPKENELYAEVSKSFKSGTLFYKGVKLCELIVENSSKTGVFKL